MSSLESAYTQPAGAAPAAINYSAPDLTRHPPRSPRTRIGGYVHLARMIDKARAFAAGRLGDFHYPCPFDQRLLSYTGISADAFLAEVKAGKSDGELLAFVQANAQPKRHPSEVAAWSAWMEQLTVSAVETRAFFNEVHKKNAAHREDISTWFDWLELDDFVTYGGKP